MVKGVFKDYNPLELENEIREYWSSNNIKKKIKESKKGGRNFYITDTPDDLEEDFSIELIYKNVLYDILTRYHIMNNYNVKISQGYNDFSSNVYNLILKENNLDTLEETTEMNEELLKSWKNISRKLINKNENLLKDLGIWKDKKEKYRVSRESFINSIWWTISELYDNDLFNKYKRERPFCTNCNKIISKNDLISNKESNKEYILKIPVKRGKNRFLFLKAQNIFSLLNNIGIGVQANSRFSVISYVSNGKKEKGIITKEELDYFIKKMDIKDYEEINIIPGKKIHGFEYINPIEKHTKYRKTIKEQIKNKVIATKNISKQDNKIFLITPGITKEALDIIEKENLDFNYSLDITEKLGVNIKYKDCKDMQIKDLEGIIEGDLTKLDVIKYSKKEEKERDLCPYCSLEISYQEVEEWSLDIKHIKEKIEDIAQETEWFPEWSSPVEDFNELDDIKNWSISTENGIGIPLPLWTCECGENKVFKSTDELWENTNKKIKNLMFPKSLGNLEIKCDKCEGLMNWERKIVHKNFIKSISPWAQIKYPKNKKNFQNWWPSKIILEKFMDLDGVIFRNIAISSALFNEPSIEKVFSFGKASGNIDMNLVKNQVGFDSLRLKFIENSPPWEDKDINITKELKSNKIVKVLWNIFNFYNSILNDFTVEDESIDSIYEDMMIEDKWLLSKSQNIIKKVNDYMDEYRFDKVISLLEEFVVIDVAQWYIGIARKRLKEGDEIDKNSILITLKEILNVLSIITAPLIPYISEKIFIDINSKKESVLMSDISTDKKSLIDQNIEDMKEIIDEIVSDIFNLKKDMELPLKWPFSRIIIDSSSEEDFKYFEEFKHVLMNKGRINEIEILEPDEEWEELVLTVEANRKAIGKTYRQWASRIALLLENRDPKEIKKGIEKGDYNVGIEGHLTEIQPNMVIFKKELPEGFVRIDYNDFKMYIDTEISEDIWNQQIANEITLRLQSMRNEFDLDDEDEIGVYIHPPDEYIEAIEDYKEDIIMEAGARNINIVYDEIEETEYILEWDINGEAVELGINPLYKTNMIQIYQSIPGMNEELAERLYQEGYTSLDILKQATARDISSINGFKRSLARRIVQTMKEKGEKLKKGEIEEKELISRVDKERRKFSGELQKITGIGKAIAGKIIDLGYHSFEDIDSANIDELMKIDYMKEETAKRLLEYTGRKHTQEVGKEVSKSIDTKKRKQIKKEAEEKEDKEESLKEKLPEGIFRSSTYMISSKDDKKGFELFKKIIETNMEGLCISREYPKKLKNKYNLQDISVLWLSNVDRKNAIRPKNLEKLSLRLEKFLGAGGGVILFNGLEYLVTNNDFRTVLHFLQSLKDQVAITESILLISINSKALEDYQLDLLNSEMDKVLE